MLGGGGGVHEKPIEGLPKKGRAWTMSRFKRGDLTRKRVVVLLTGG